MSQRPQPSDSSELIAETADSPGKTPRRPRRAIPLVAGGLTLLLAGGAGGYLLAGSGGDRVPVGPAASTGIDPNVSAGGPGGPGRGRHGGPGQGTAGTIDSINGSTITLTTRDGRKVTVTAANTVPVTLRTQGSVSDLKPGQNIIVSGQSASDGSVTARMIAVGGAR